MAARSQRFLGVSVRKGHSSSQSSFIKKNSKPSRFTPFKLCFSFTMGAAMVATVLLFLFLLTCLPAAAMAAPDHEGISHQRQNFFINGRYGKRGSSLSNLLQSSSGNVHQHGDSSNEVAAPLTLPVEGPAMAPMAHRIQSKSPAPKPTPSRVRSWFHFGRASEYDPRPFYISTRYGKRASVPANYEIAEPGAPLPFEAGQDLTTGNVLNCIYSGLADLYHCVRDEEASQDDSGSQPDDQQGPLAH